jgi:hypothetical protein
MIKKDLIIGAGVLICAAVSIILFFVIRYVKRAGFHSMKRYLLIGGGVLVSLAVIFVLFYIGSSVRRVDADKAGAAYEPSVVISQQENTYAAGRDELKITIPANTLPAGTRVEVAKAGKKPLAENQHYVSDVYEVKTSAELEEPVMIEITFDPNKVPADKMDNLFAAYWDKNEWVPAPDGVVDLSRNVVIVKTDHLSIWTALYDATSGIWNDRIDDVEWNDVPGDLREKVQRDWGIQRQDVKAILHAQFSSITKGATFVFGIANQMVNVSSILGGIESGGELAKAVIEKVAEDTLSSRAGQAGEMAVTLYEAGKTGLAVGTAVASIAVNLTVKTAEVQAALPQVLGWVLEKEMAYFNANTSQIFEYLSLYDSGWGQRLDTYIFFYDAPYEGKLRNRGVMLYYWSPTYEHWQRGKNISLISDVFVKVFETAETQTPPPAPPPAETQTPPPAPPPAPAAREPSFSKNKFPSSLLGRSLMQSQEMDFAVGCLENASVQKSYQAVYGNGDIIVSVNKFSSAAAAQNGPQDCVHWASQTLGVKLDLTAGNSVSGRPFWTTYGPFNGQNRALSSSFAAVDAYLIDATVNPGIGSTEGNHREIMAAMINALMQ